MPRTHARVPLRACQLQPLHFAVDVHQHNKDMFPELFMRLQLALDS